MLSAAQEHGWLSADGAEYGWRVWLQGNAAVHNDPETTSDALETIHMTMYVLHKA